MTWATLARIAEVPTVQALPLLKIAMIMDSVSMISVIVPQDGKEWVV